MKGADVKKLDDKIKVQKAKFDYLKKLIRMIENNATGFDLAYEMEKEKKILRKINLFSASKIKRFKKIGNSKFSDKNITDRANYRVIMDYFRQKNDEIKKEVEYLEYKKSKPGLNEINDLINLSIQLGKSIEYLDNKFKEWKK